MPSARGPAGLAVASGFCPGLGPVRTGAGPEAAAGRGVVGRSCLDYEAFVGKALLASPDHYLRGTRLPPGIRARVLRKAAGLVERHVVARTLLCGAPLGRCRSLLPLGGRVCASLSARPFFTTRHEVMLRLMRLATHCWDTWVRRLRTPARIRPPVGDSFLMEH